MEPPKRSATQETPEVKESRVSIDTSIWGPPLWDMLFTLAFRCRTEDVDHLKRILALLKEALPCYYCRQSYQKFYKRFPPENLKTPSEVTQWLWTTKDMVNQKLRKPYRPYAEIKLRYTVFQHLTSFSIILDLLGLITKSLRTQQGHIIRELTSSICGVAHVFLGSQMADDLLSSLPLTTAPMLDFTDYFQEVANKAHVGSHPFLQNTWIVKKT